VRTALASLLLLAGFAGAAEPARVAVPAPENLRNPWPADWEKEFRSRADAVLKAQCAKEKVAGLGGRTYFENEKRAYGILMAHAVAGDRDAALKELQKEDAQAKEWHKHTEGIDYYACFTLKHQMRKYFLFGDRMEPAYRKRMFDGAKAWTEKDPLRRPHYAFTKPGEGWGPDVLNSWVDVRNTENLFLMRVTSVYLMAEETGNEATRKQYKEILLAYARSLYRVGMGEWDSENYHGHSLSPLLNIFDFAKDADVKAAAKASLDYLCAIGAVKYYRGAFTGPSNRDYNHPQPFGGSAAAMLWLYFGDSPTACSHFESDEVHVVTSGYRPPAAVVHLARKNFDRPAEIFSSKPAYIASTTGDLKSPPEYYETHHFGKTYQMGSLAGGTSVGTSAVNGFKIAAFDSKAGAAVIQAVPGPDPLSVGSAKYAAGKVSGANRIGQYRNLAVWLVEGGESPWVWTFPDSIGVEVERGVTFLKAERTWIALHPLNLSELKLDADLTKAVIEPAKKNEAWPGHRVLSAKGKGGKFCGVAVEIGEAPDHKDYSAFKKAVLAKGAVDAAAIDEGTVSFTGTDGKSVKLRFAHKQDELAVWRDGRRHDWIRHAESAFGSVGKTAAPIEQVWLGGKLTVRAGGAKFAAMVSDTGIATFENE